MKKNVKKQLAKKRPNVSRGFTSKTFDVNDFVMPYPIQAPTSIVSKNTKHVKILMLNKPKFHIIKSKIFCEVKKHYPFQHGKIHVIFNFKSYIDKQLKTQNTQKPLKRSKRFNFAKQEFLYSSTKKKLLRTKSLELVHIRIITQSY